MVAWGAIAGLAGNLAGSFSHSNAQQGLNRADTDWMYQKQSDYWKNNTTWFNQNGYSLLRQGLEKAGYNPLMALGAQPMSGATVSGNAMDSVQNATSVDIPNSFRQLQENLRNTHADTGLKFAQTEENLSRASLENAEKLLKDERLPYEGERASEEVKNIIADTNLKNEQVRQAQALTTEAFTRADLNRMETKYKKVLADMTDQNKKYFEKIVEKLGADLELSKPERDWIRNHPEASEFLSGVRQYGNAFGSILHSINFNSHETYNVSGGR